MVSNSDLNNLPKVLVAPPAYLKYSRVENLLRSKESVNASDVLFISCKLALNLPVLLIEFTKLDVKFA